MFTDKVVIGGFADIRGVAEPLTLVMDGNHVTGGIAACVLIFALGVFVDWISGTNPTGDRVAGVIYYSAGVSLIAFLGMSKPIQDAVRGLDVKGQAVDGMLLASLCAMAAHVYLVSVVFTGLKPLQGLQGHNARWFGVGVRKPTDKLNKRIMWTFPLIAATLPMGAGFFGFVLGFIARASTWATLEGASFLLMLAGAQ
jgi:hypothetical protein